MSREDWKRCMADCDPKLDHDLAAGKRGVVRRLGKCLAKCGSHPGLGGTRCRKRRK